MGPVGKSSVLVIMGSVRHGRRCPQITRWVCDLVEQSGALACEIIDLKDWSLPSDDEPDIPAKGGYRQPHTRAWSAKVASAHGVLIVTPQYNWGYPAPLKNALDHLFKEWNGKPLMIVTYGGHGGGKCAMQLRQVADGLKMKPVETTPTITLPKAVIEEDLPLTAMDLNAHEEAVRRAAAELAAMMAGA